MFGHDNRFWWVVLIAATIRVLTAEYSGPALSKLFRGFVTGSSAIFAAVVFTDPVVDLSGFPPDIYKVPFAALLALTGDGLMRILVSLNWSQLLDALRAWRGK